MSEPNLYRTENYQNYINSFHSKPRVAKSISDVHKKIDDDNESINSVAESLNNYLDVKVCFWLMIRWRRSLTRDCSNVFFRSLTMLNRRLVALQNLRVRRRVKPNRCSGECSCSKNSLSIKFPDPAYLICHRVNSESHFNWSLISFLSIKFDKFSFDAQYSSLYPQLTSIASPWSK